MAPDLETRPAGSADLEAIVSLLGLCGLPHDDVDASILGEFVVSELGARTVGVCGLELHGSDALLRSLAVAPDARSEAVGGALVADRLERARELGLRRVYLLTTDAADYFRRFGFRESVRDEAPEGIRNSREFSSICPATAVLMSRPPAGAAR